MKYVGFIWYSSTPGNQLAEIELMIQNVEPTNWLVYKLRMIHSSNFNTETKLCFATLAQTEYKKR